MCEQQLRHHRCSSLPFRIEIAFVALSLFHLRFRFTLHILGDRLAHVNLVFREPALIVPADIALIARVRLDELAIFGYDAAPLSL